MNQGCVASFATYLSHVSIHETDVFQKCITYSYPYVCSYSNIGNVCVHFIHLPTLIILLKKNVGYIIHIHAHIVRCEIDI